MVAAGCLWEGMQGRTGNEFGGDSGPRGYFRILAIKKFREDAIEQFAPSIPAAGGFDF